MAEIIPFPSKPMRLWQAFAEIIDKNLEDIGADEDMRKIVIERMKSFYEKISKDISFSVSLQMPEGTTQEKCDEIKSSIIQGVNEGINQIKQLGSELLVDRLKTEIYIYRLEREKGM